MTVTGGGSMAKYVVYVYRFDGLRPECHVAENAPSALVAVQYALEEEETYKVEIHKLGKGET